MVESLKQEDLVVKLMELARTELPTVYDALIGAYD